MEKINEALKKEQSNLDALLKKRASLDSKIKTAEKNIERYTDMLNKQKFNFATDVLNASGLELDDLIEALKNGNLASLENKIKNGKASEHVENDSDGSNNVESDGNVESERGEATSV